MSLRKRIVLFGVLALIAAVSFQYAAAQLILLRGYQDIETQEVTQDLQRGTNALTDRIRDLDKIAIGYAQWNDTRDFVQGLKPSYVEDNLTATVYADTGIDAAIFLNAQGEIVLQKAYDRQTGLEVPVSSALNEHLKPGGLLLHHANVRSKIAGILALPEGSMIIISMPISNNQGIGPINGYMVWGRYVDAELISQIVESTRFDISMQPYHDFGLETDFLKARAALSDTAPFYVHPIDDEQVSGFTVVNDVYGDPALLVRIVQPRTLYQQGQASLSYFLAALVVAAVASITVALMLINRVVLVRLASLSATITAIRTTDDLSAPVSVQGADELGNLADGLREMLRALSESRGQLLDSNAQLEQRVAERTAELTRLNSQLMQAQLLTAQARDEALEALSVRSQIIANISHDSRTPLTAIGLNVDILRRGHFGALSDKQNQILDRITASSKRLMSLITNLLSEAQLNNDKLKLALAPLSPRELMRDLEKLFLPLAEQKGLALTIDIKPDVPEILVGDSERLKQILSNLVDNAIKFTEGGSVKITVDTPDCDHWSFRVADSGKGIPAESQPRIFEAFWQVDGSATRTSNRGIGLGLSIVKRLVTAMNGEICVESTPGSGTAFVITLPVQEQNGEHRLEPAYSYSRG